MLRCMSKRFENENRTTFPLESQIATKTLPAPQSQMSPSFLPYQTDQSSHESGRRPTS